MKTTRNLLVAGMVAAFCCSVSSAQIVYTNAFNGGHANINNTAPTAAYDFAGGSSTGTWLDALGTNDNGFMNLNGQTSTTLGDSWTLPFTVQAGYIYNLTATLTFSGNPNNWMGIGFAQLYNTDNLNGYGRFSDHGNASGTTTGGPNGYDWMIFNQGSGNIQYFAGPHAANVIYAANGAFTTNLVGSLNINITLNTAGGQWYTTAAINGTQLGNWYTYSANPTIGAVGITQTAVPNPNLYQWSDFMLSAVAVPEPSTPALVGLGVAMLLLVTLYRNRRDAAGKAVRQ